MPKPAYISQSRHGIFYFRWPLPAAMHPKRKRHDIRLSLGTRSRAVALRMARLLAALGENLPIPSIGSVMNYDELREQVRQHFQGSLNRFQADIAQDGPPAFMRLEALRTSLMIAQADNEDWPDMANPKGASGLLDSFCNLRGIVEEELTPEKRNWLLKALQRGHACYCATALSYAKRFDNIDLEAPLQNTSATVHAGATAKISDTELLAFYFEEASRTASLAKKPSLRSARF